MGLHRKVRVGDIVRVTHIGPGDESELFLAGAITICTEPQEGINEEFEVTVLPEWTHSNKAEPGWEIVPDDDKWQIVHDVSKLTDKEVTALMKFRLLEKS